MKFLVAVAAQVLQWLLEKLGSYLNAVFKRLKKEKEIEEEAKASVEDLKKAKTGEEVDKATDTALDKF